MLCVCVCSGCWTKNYMLSKNNSACHGGREHRRIYDYYRKKKFFCWSTIIRILSSRGKWHRITRHFYCVPQDNTPMPHHRGAKKKNAPILDELLPSSS